MALFTLENVSFTYPGAARAALSSIHASIESGTFNVICGLSGSGKTTLLRLFKPSLTPHGACTGSFLFEGKPLSALGAEEEARRIGFVQQSPDRQIVTDKVWHELAFGLECTGAPKEICRLRSAELAGYFGLSPLLHRDTHTLSGGQKQLLNLASVMAMEPDVLILDEPTAQLDPVAAADFLSVLARLHRDFGTTILLSEHHLALVLPEADRLFVLNGGKLSGGSVTETARRLKVEKDPMFHALPAVVQAGTLLRADPCPISVAQGRTWLEGRTLLEPDFPAYKRPAEKPLLVCRDVSFTYAADAPNVLRDCSFSVYPGECFALLGANGSGKSTLLSLLSGQRIPYSGTILLNGKKPNDRRQAISFACLPQDPQLLFCKETIGEELLHAAKCAELSKEEADIRIRAVCADCALSDELLNLHPYDLSGGEQQRAALAILLLASPKLLLLDEPTKGLDVPYKEALCALLKKFTQDGMTILFATHDMEFCAAAADRCALLFDGSPVLCCDARSFFLQNRFYTTQTVRLTRGRSACIKTEELLSALKTGEGAV